MPERSQIWTGSLSFGLVSVPVSLVSATRDLDFHFRQLHAVDMSPIEQRRFCSEEGVEVGWDEVGRGYELEGGEMIVLTEKELEAVAPERTRTVEIEAFVDIEQIDPIRFIRTYHLAPTGKSEGDRRAYRLLAAAMEETGRAGIGRVVMRSREYLVMVRVREGVLALTTLLFHDEVRTPDDIPIGEATASRSSVKEAVAILGELTVEWDPGKYKDRYRERLAKVIRQKRRGQRVRVADADELRELAERPTEAPDLMAALKRTLEEAQGGRRRRSRVSGPAKTARSSGDRRGDGGSTHEPLDRLSRDQLYQRAQKVNLPGRSSMSKDELRRALRSR